MRFVWTGNKHEPVRHTREWIHAGGDTVELHEGDEPAALMIPHGGGNATRQRVHQATHTANTAKHTKGAKQTMSACTPCAKLLLLLSEGPTGREYGKQAGLRSIKWIRDPGA